MQATAVAQVTRSHYSPLHAETSLSRLIFSIVFISLLIPLSSEAATYYTKKTGNDGNSCAAAQNEATPKLTIIAGKNCLTSPGDTLIVGNGTYVEAGINMSVSGTLGNPITIRAQNNLQAILSSISGTTCAPNISFNASYIVIDGLRGQINAADPFCAPNSATGAFVRMWPGFAGGTVKNCQVDAHPNRSVGIKSNQDNSLVENCHMHSSLEGFIGIDQVWRNNYIDTADAWGDLFTCKGGARNCQFYNNTLHKTGGWHALVLGGNSSCCMFDGTGYECYNCVAYNNVVVMDSGSGQYAASLVACSNCSLFNNVFINASLSFEQGGSAGATPQIFPRNPTVKNNIFYCNGAAAHSSSNSFTGTFTEDYNNFYNCSGTPSQAHSIVGDPRLVDPWSDWHLRAGSPAIGSGTLVSFLGFSGGVIDVSKDADGLLRIVPWSLGRYRSLGTTDNTPPIAPTGLVVN
jgi:hypothetical protein